MRLRRGPDLRFIAYIIASVPTQRGSLIALQSVHRVCKTDGPTGRREQPIFRWRDPDGQRECKIDPTIVASIERRIGGIAPQPNPANR